MSLGTTAYSEGLRVSKPLVGMTIKRQKNGGQRRKAKRIGKIGRFRKGQVKNNTDHQLDSKSTPMDSLVGHIAKRREEW